MEINKKRKKEKIRPLSGSKFHEAGCLILEDTQLSMSAHVDTAPAITQLHPMVRDV